MQAITITDRAAGLAGLALQEVDHPIAVENDVIVRVHAAGFTAGELSWPATWTDRAGRDRTPTIPGHELSGVVAQLGYGTTGLTVGQRVFGFADWSRNGTLAEYVAVEARNLAPLPAAIDHVVAAALPIAGLTAWQGLFEHGHLEAGQTVMIDGAAGSVGTLAVQLASAAGAFVIAAGRPAQRDTVIQLGAGRFVELGADSLDDVGPIDLLFDVLGGDVRDRATDLVREGGAVVTIADPPTRVPRNVRGLFFVVEPDRRQLVEIAERVRRAALHPIIGSTVPLAEAPSALRSKPSAVGRVVVTV